VNITQRTAHPANYTKGRQGHRPNLILIHVADGTFEGTIAWFRNPASSVSAHYVISTAGEIAQCVDEGDTGWHAGNWNANLASIGIEHEGSRARDRGRRRRRSCRPARHSWRASANGTASRPARHTTHPPQQDQPSAPLPRPDVAVARVPAGRAGPQRPARPGPRQHARRQDDPATLRPRQQHAGRYSVPHFRHGQGVHRAHPWR